MSFGWGQKLGNFSFITHIASQLLASCSLDMNCSSVTRHTILTEKLQVLVDPPSRGPCGLGSEWFGSSERHWDQLQLLSLPSNPGEPCISISLCTQFGHFISKVKVKYIGLVDFWVVLRTNYLLRGNIVNYTKILFFSLATQRNPDAFYSFSVVLPHRLYKMCFI